MGKSTGAPMVHMQMIIELHAAILLTQKNQTNARRHVRTHKILKKTQDYDTKPLFSTTRSFAVNMQ